MNSDLKKQAQAQKLHFQGENKTISRTNLFQQYIKNLSESEFEFLSSYYKRNSQMHIRSENLFY